MKTLPCKTYVKLLLLIIAILFAFTKTQAQGYQPEGSKVLTVRVQGGFMIDSIFILPTTLAYFSLYPKQGRMYFNKSDSSIYYNTGYSWVKIWSGSGGSGWSLTGNAGTNPSANFIGTTDSESLVFKVNNYQSGLIDDVLFNTSFGWRSFQSNTTGSYNCGFGEKSLYNNTSGFGNGALGGGALFSNNTGSHNNALGCKSLYLNQVGNYNVAIGDSTLFNNLGSSNIANGSWALRDNTTGLANAAIGTSSLKLNKTGNGNVANGTSSGFSVNSDYNTLLGHLCGGGLKYGGYNTFIGAGLTTPDSNTRYQIWLGTGDGTKRGWFDSVKWNFQHEVVTDTFVGKIALSEIYPAPSTGTVTNFSINDNHIIKYAVSNPTTTPSVTTTPQTVNAHTFVGNNTIGRAALDTVLLTPADMPILPYVTSVSAGAGLSGGTWTTAGTVSMPNVGTAGTYGSPTAIPVITTDAQGRSSITTTSVTPTPILAGNGISVAGSTVTNKAPFNLKFPYQIPGGVYFTDVTGKVAQDANLIWDGTKMLIGSSVQSYVNYGLVNMLQAPPITSLCGMLNLGDGYFSSGSGFGQFTGNANGTYIAISATNHFIDFLRFQYENAGSGLVDAFRVDGSGKIYSGTIQAGPGNFTGIFNSGVNAGFDAGGNFSGKTSIVVNSLPRLSVLTGGAVTINTQTDNGIDILQVNGSIGLYGNLNINGISGLPGQVVTQTPSGNIWAYPSNSFNGIYNNSSGTSVNGSVSGNAVLTMPDKGSAVKFIVIDCVALVRTATFTFPVACTYTPDVLTTTGLSSSLVTSVSNTSVTVTGTTSTGRLYLLSK